METSKFWWWEGRQKADLQDQQQTHLCVGSDSMPTVRLEAELCTRADKALQAGPQCSSTSSADPDPKEPCLSRSVKVTLSPLLCARLDILSK